MVPFIFGWRPPEIVVPVSKAALVVSLTPLRTSSIVMSYLSHMKYNKCKLMHCNNDEWTEYYTYRNKIFLIALTKCSAVFEYTLRNPIAKLTIFQWCGTMK